jgi:hypothetical protein
MIRITMMQSNAGYFVVSFVGMCECVCCSMWFQELVLVFNDNDDNDYDDR